jgi:hypothetical protein
LNCVIAPTVATLDMLHRVMIAFLAVVA